MGVWTTTVKDWADGTTPGAADFDAQLRDFANAFGAASTYTPTLTATSSNPTLGTGNVRSGRYFRVQKQGWLSVQIWVASSGYAAGTGTYEIDLPAGWTPVTLPRPLLTALVALGGANPTAYTARVETSGTKLRLYRGDASAALAGATLTANSTIEVSGWMELA